MASSTKRPTGALSPNCPRATLRRVPGQIRGVTPVQRFPPTWVADMGTEGTSAKPRLVADYDE